jgi:hypothetical protein
VISPNANNVETTAETKIKTHKAITQQHPVSKLGVNCLQLLYKQNIGNIQHLHCWETSLTTLSNIHHLWQVPALNIKQNSNIQHSNWGTAYHLQATYA